MYRAKFLAVAFVAMFIWASAYGRDVGGEVLPFIRIDRNPASAAMGFAGAASTSDIAYAAFGNSAVIPFAGSKFGAAVSYQNWAPDGVKSNNINAGAAFKLADYLGFSLGFAYQAGETYSETSDISGASDGTFTPNDFVINGGMGVKITEFLSVGMNLRYARQSLASDTAYSSFGGDLLIYCTPVRGLGLAAGVVSLGTPVKSEDHKTYDIPTSAKVAGDYRAEFSVHSLKAGLDLDYFFSGKFCAAAGVQYGFKDMLFVCAGYHLGSDDAVLPSFATVGAGVKFAGVRLDLAFITANDVIGNTVSVGLSYSF